MSDVELKVGADAGDLLRGLKQAKEELIAMRDAAEKAKKELADSMQTGAKATQAFEAEIQRLLSLQKAQADYIDKLNKKIAEYDAALVKATNAGDFAKQTQKIAELKDEIEKLKKQLQELAAASKANTEAGKNDNDVTNKKNTLLRQLVISLNNAAKAFNGLKKVIVGLGFSAVISYITDFINSINLFGSSAEKNAERLEKLNDELERQKKLMRENIGLIDFETKMEIERMKRSGSSTWAIGTKELVGMNKQLNEMIKTADKAERALQQGLWIEKGVLFDPEKDPFEEESDGLKKLRKEYEDANNDVLAQRRALALASSKNITKLFEDRKKEEEKLAKEREKNAKAAEKEEEARLRRLYALEKELAYARIEPLADNRKKELLKEELNYLYAIKDLEVKKIKASEQEKVVIDKLAEQEIVNSNARKLKINTAYFEEVSKLMREAQENAQEITLKGEELDIMQVNSRFDKILETIADARKRLLAAGVKEGSLEFQILGGQSKQVEEARQKEITDVTNKWALDRLEKLEDIASAENEILTMAGVNGKKLEEIKERNKLYIIINYGKRKLALLESIGGEENKVQIAQIKKSIQDAQKALSAMGASKFSLVKLLGLDSLKPEELEAVMASVDILKSALSEAAGSLISIQDNAINKSRERINQIEDEIRAQEDALKREKDLAAEGYANNVAMEERRIADLKSKKAAEQQIEKEALAKKKEMQRTQLMIDSATQASSLSTAIANIIKVYSSLPLGGQILAATAIAASVAAFTYGKIQAFKAINTTTAKKGRRVAKGKSHDQGGNKYLSMDGNDPHIFELQKGEWVVNDESSKKYDPVLEAINNDTLDKMSRSQLRRILKPYGIHLETEASTRISKKVEAATAGKVVVIKSQDDDANWEKQNNILKGMGTKEKTIDYVPGYRIEREGNRVRKIKLND